MLIPSRPMDRRTLLRGVGVSLGLPWLEGMSGMTSWAQDSVPKAPNRMAFLYVPNGKNMADWTPKTPSSPTPSSDPTSPGFELSPILEPLAQVKDKLLVVSGLTADGARAYADGGGDHARALSAFLTGARPLKTDGVNIRNGVSVDQVAASRVGRKPLLHMRVNRACASALDDQLGVSTTKAGSSLFSLPRP